jgi:hypothetical protein
MSLQLAAQHMASRGRGPDTQLVHMAPSEVAGLHALARAHGGSLTTNPDTGLPEAGFLSSILPMVIGAGLSIASGGALTPLMAAGITGAGYGVATGSLSKGLMAGLGAFGGAGLGAGLSAAGTAGAGMSALDAGMGVMPTGTIGAAEVLAPTALDAGMGAMPTGGIGVNALDAGLGAYPNANLAASPIASPLQAQQAVMQAAPQTVTPMADRFAQAGQGFQNLGSEAGRDAFMGKTGVDGAGGLMKYGLAAATPMMMQEPAGLPKPKDYKARDYDFSYNRVADPDAGYTGAFTGERTYLNPTFTERTAAGGGLMDIGPVQAMSDQNRAQMMMANGGQMFAEGGETSAVAPVEENPYYTMSGQSGDAFKYLMGQMPSSASIAPALAPAPTPVSAPTPGSSTYGNPSNSAIRPYTFNPATNVFTAMPIIEPNTLPLDAAPVYADYSAPAGEAPQVGGGYGYANGGIAMLARGGPSHLGDYSDGGRLLRGPGDGVSDSIPATIADKRPARLADGEFVVSADVVSGLGNGSTEAGARKLYAMMDRVRKARTGTKKMGKTVNPDRLVPV